MESLRLEDLSLENQEKYRDIIQKYNITNLYYIEDEKDKLNITDLTVDGYTMRMSKSFKTLFPIKKYFTIMMESKSRENIKEPYWNFRIKTLDKLLEDQSKIKE